MPHSRPPCTLNIKVTPFEPFWGLGLQNHCNDEMRNSRFWMIELPCQAHRLGNAIGNRRAYIRDFFRRSSGDWHVATAVRFIRIATVGFLKLPLIGDHLRAPCL